MELKILKGKGIEDRVYEVKEYIGLEDNEHIDGLGVDENNVLYIETSIEDKGDKFGRKFYSRTIDPKENVVNPNIVDYVVKGKREHLLALKAYKDYEETFNT